jgi:hypothetical protein
VVRLVALGIEKHDLRNLFDGARLIVCLPKDLSAGFWIRPVQ